MEAEVVASTFTIPQQVTVDDGMGTVHQVDEILQPNRASMNLLVHTDTVNMSRIRTVSECNIDDISFVDTSGSVLDQMLANEEMMSGNDPWVMPTIGDVSQTDNSAARVQTQIQNMQIQYPNVVFTNNNNKVTITPGKSLLKHALHTGKNIGTVSIVDKIATVNQSKPQPTNQRSLLDPVKVMSLAPTPPPSSASSCQSLTEDDFNVLHLDDSSVVELDNFPLFNMDGDMGNLLDQFEEVSNVSGQLSQAEVDGDGQLVSSGWGHAQGGQTQNVGVQIIQQSGNISQPKPPMRSNSEDSPEVVRLLQAKRTVLPTKHGSVAALSGTTPPPTPPPGVINRIKKSASSQRKTIMVDPQPRTSRGRADAAKAKQNVFASRKLRKLLGHTADSGSDSERGVPQNMSKIISKNSHSVLQNNSAFARISNAIEEELKYPGTPETITAPSTPAQIESITSPLTPGPASEQNSRCSTPDSSAKKKISLSVYKSTRLVGNSLQKRSSSGSNTPISGRSSPVKEFEDNTQLIMDTVRAKLNAQINANRFSTAQSQQNRPASYYDVILDHDYCQRSLAKSGQALQLPLSVSKPGSVSAQNSPSKHASNVSSYSNSPQNSPRSLRKGASAHVSEGRSKGRDESRTRQVSREKLSSGNHTHRTYNSNDHSERREWRDRRHNRYPHRDDKNIDASNTNPSQGHSLYTRHSTAPEITRRYSPPITQFPNHGLARQKLALPHSHSDPTFRSIEETSPNSSKSQNLKELLLDPTLEEEVKAQAVVDREECMRRMSGEADDKKGTEDREVIDMELDSDMETECFSLLDGNSINPSNDVIINSPESDVVLQQSTVSVNEFLSEDEIAAAFSHAQNQGVEQNQILEQTQIKIENKQNSSDSNSENSINNINSVATEVGYEKIDLISGTETANQSKKVTDHKSACEISKTVKKETDISENECVISIKPPASQNGDASKNVEKEVEGIRTVEAVSSEPGTIQVKIEPGEKSSEAETNELNLESAEKNAELSDNCDKEENEYVEIPVVKNKRDPLNLMSDHKSAEPSNGLGRTRSKTELLKKPCDKFKENRPGNRNRKNFRKRNGSPKVETEPTFDKLPSYCTALAIQAKNSKGRGIPSSKLLDSSLPVRDRDLSPDRSDPVFNKVPEYFSCFTNSTKYDVDNHGEPLRLDDEPEETNAQGIAREESSSKYDLDMDRRTPYLVINTQSNSTTASRNNSREPSRANSRVNSRENSMSRTQTRSQGVSRPTNYGSHSRSNSPSNSRSRRSNRDRKRSYSSSSSRSRSYSSSGRSRSRSRSRSASRYDRFASERSIPRRKRRRYSRSRSISRDRWRDGQRFNRDKGKTRQMEQRRIVYVGGISDNCTRAELRKIFSVFGEIEETNVHFREHGDNYGFVTFRNSCHAYDAIEGANKVKGCEKYDLCFGGRRHFCKNEYADLDGNMEDEEEMASVMPMSKQSSEPDFDELLRQALKKSKKKR